jgi:hypothetical protein
MSNRQFHLVTQWQFDAPIDVVWQVLSKTEDWPQWWKAVLAVEQLESGDENGIGAYRRMHWRTALPYRLAFNTRTTKIEKHRLIEGQSEGELAGIGRWQLTVAGEHTIVRYDWIVDVTKKWMRVLLPVLRPMFAWNHNRVMEWGRAGFVERLNKLDK